ncbi:hypothetical protein TAGGR_316 [Thermodesulfovibrio aggregans]|uniref:Transposase n=1 Tax=Thermodesulfovibrio aggregans TaxID=86166 RepID=A0A0U9HR91_9BACT|nr:hypothetical protein [Thermodesulfovibrio aggregans]GAQ95544.1 hypothetical protein TAGGR_316 [Thermodesulfovibrio aggregans]
MPTVGVNSNVCATCQYWMGARQFTSKKVIHFDEMGICMASRSSYRGKETRGMQHCGQWMKWLNIEQV